MFCVLVSEGSDHYSRRVRSGRGEHVVKAAHVMEVKEAEEKGAWPQILHPSGSRPKDLLPPTGSVLWKASQP